MLTLENYFSYRYLTNWANLPHIAGQTHAVPSRTCTQSKMYPWSLGRPIYRSFNLKWLWTKVLRSRTYPTPTPPPLTNAWFHFSPSPLHRCRSWTSSAVRFSKLSAFCRLCFDRRSWFKRCGSNLQESCLFSLAHYKLSAAMTFRRSSSTGDI